MASIPPTSAASTTRGARSCQSDRVVDRAEWLLDVQARDVRERRAEDRSQPDVHRPDRETDDERDEEEAGRDEAGAEADAAGLDPRRSLQSSGRDCHLLLLGDLRYRRREVDDPRPPARRDVVTHADDVVVRDGLDATPARPRRNGGRGLAAALRVGEDDDLRVRGDDVLARELRVVRPSRAPAALAMFLKPKSL